MQLTGFTPHTKQREILNTILESKAKYHVVSVGRQFGKSLMGINLLLYWAINHPKSTILWVSPVYSQTSKVQKEISSAIGNHPILTRSNLSSNEMEFATGSKVIFRSAERYDNIRGFSIDYAIIDEAAFIRKEAWEEAIKPTLLVKGKKALFLSTPKGKNWFHDLFQLGKNPDYPQYQCYKGNSYDTPFIQREEIDEARKTLPEGVFKQEYLAEFLDSGGEVFQNIEMNQFNAWSSGNSPYFAGLDLAKQEDYTVLTILDKEGKIVDYYRNNRVEWSKMVTDILEKLNKWKPSLLVEVNSIGDVIYEQIKKKYQNTHPFVTTGKSKTEIVEGLILDFNEQTIKIPNETIYPALNHEMSIFTYDYNVRTRSVKYGHPPGQHDDTVISLALANYWRKKGKSLGTYAVSGMKLR